MDENQTTIDIELDKDNEQDDGEQWDDECNNEGIVITCRKCLKIPPMTKKWKATNINLIENRMEDAYNICLLIFYNLFIRNLFLFCSIFYITKLLCSRNILYENYFNFILFFLIFDFDYFTKNCFYFIILYLRMIFLLY